MQFEQEGGPENDLLIYTVTDIAGDQVVLDGNHPLAGLALNFACTVVAVREATAGEIERGYADDDAAGPLITVVQ
jgi:FKBP-type peptidyl-prolyl cis-trans isomerase SlyD